MTTEYVMETEEAINHLTTVRNTCVDSGYDPVVKEALNMAISALRLNKQIVEFVNSAKDRNIERYGADIIEGYSDLFDELRDIMLTKEDRVDEV